MTFASRHAGKEVRYERAYALIVAKALVYHLEPHCERIAIAGSLRRRKKRVKDIEIVALPKIEVTRTDLFGQAIEKRSALQKGLESYNRHEYGGLEFRRTEEGTVAGDGERMKLLRDVKTGIPIDLFIVHEPQVWGYILCLRTGPANWNKKVLEVGKRNGLTFHKGRVLDANMRPVELYEEKDYFRACGVRYKEPWLRGVT